MIPSETYDMIMECQSSALERTEKKEINAVQMRLRNERYMGKELSSDQKVQQYTEDLEIGETIDWQIVNNLQRDMEKKGSGCI